MRALLVAALFAVLVLADTALKLALDTPSWAWHEIDGRAGLPAAALLAVLGLAAAWPPLSTACAIMAAGVMGNVSWAHLSPRGVANPFVTDEEWLKFLAGPSGLGHPGDLAFNLADVTLTAGALALLLSAWPAAAALDAAVVKWRTR